MEEAEAVKADEDRLLGLQTLCKRKFGRDVDDDDDENLYEDVDGTKRQEIECCGTLADLDDRLLDLKALYKRKFGFDVDDDDDEIPYEDADGTMWQVTVGCGTLTGFEDRPPDLKAPCKRRVGFDVDEQDDESHDYVEEIVKVSQGECVEEFVAVPKAVPEEVGKFAEVPQEDELPSKGSAERASGNCRRCNFFPKGRCPNGKDCTFCHLPHVKRKPSRQEQRERRAAWLAQHQDQHGLTLDDFDEGDDDECDDNEQQVMAHSKIGAPDPSATPSVSMDSPMGPPSHPAIAAPLRAAAIPAATSALAPAPSGSGAPDPSATPSVSMDSPRGPPSHPAIAAPPRAAQSACQPDVTPPLRAQLSRWCPARHSLCSYAVRSQPRRLLSCPARRPARQPARQPIARPAMSSAQRTARRRATASAGRPVPGAYCTRVQLLRRLWTVRLRRVYVVSVAPPARCPAPRPAGARLQPDALERRRRDLQRRPSPYPPFATMDQSEGFSLTHTARAGSTGRRSLCFVSPCSCRYRPLRAQPSRWSCAGRPQLRRLLSSPARPCSAVVVAAFGPPWPGPRHSRPS